MKSRLAERTASTRRHRCRFALLVQLAVLPLLLAGCSSLWKKPVAEDLVGARQKCREGLSNLEDGQLEAAESLFREAIDECPVDERSRRCYADLLWRRGEREQAIVEMEEALRLSGGDPELVVRLGEMYLATGNLDKAEASSVHGVQSSNRIPAAWALRGDVQNARGDSQGALASYHRAISLQEHFPQVRLAIARIYQQHDRPQRALSTLAALSNNYPLEETPQDVLLLEGMALKSLGRFDDAVERLEIAARADRPSAEIYFHLSETLLLAGDPVNARHAVTQALQLNPNHQNGQRLLAWLEQSNGRMASLNR